MVYLSGTDISIEKREISKGVYRDYVKVICEKCYKSFLQEVKFTISCPFCNWTKNLLKPKHL